MGDLRTLPEALAEAARADAGYMFFVRWRRRRSAGARTPTLQSRRRSRSRARCARPACGAAISSALVLADAEQFLTTLFGASMAGLIPASLYPPATTTAICRATSSSRPASCARRARARSSRRGALAPAFEATAARRARTLSIVLSREALDAPADRAATARRRSTTSRSCSSRPGRRPRRRASRSRTATSPRTSTRSTDRRRWRRRPMTSASAGCR